MHELSGRTIVDGKVGVRFGCNIVDLRRYDLTLHIFEQALVQGSLAPVYSEVPVARPLFEAGILLEDGARDSCLQTT